MANVYEPDWDLERDQAPFLGRRAWLGRQAGSEDLGASLFELPPGAASSPLHAHYANEELIVVVAGRPTLTTPGGKRQLAEGEVVACPAGRRGAHRLDNETDAPVRVLIVSTMRSPEINEMYEDGDYWLRSYVPGTEGAGAELDVRVSGRAQTAPSEKP
jgi:uncharacterized cupin superfamily protein